MIMDFAVVLDGVEQVAHPIGATGGAVRETTWGRQIARRARAGAVINMVYPGGPMRLANLATTFVSLSALALGMEVIAACGNSSGGGGSATCSSQGKCPGDKPQTADQMNKCAASLADPTCTAKYQTVINCFFTKEECAADGGAGPFQT